MNRFKVYLAGPISGLTYDEGQDWRAYAVGVLASRGIEGFSPLRRKDFLRHAGVIEGAFEFHELASSRGIMTRDHFDCQTSDVILANLLGSKRVTIGTVMEIAWAFAYRKPLVVVMEPEGNLHEHPMIAEAIGYRVSTLDAALNVVSAILHP